MWDFPLELPNFEWIFMCAKNTLYKHLSRLTCAEGAWLVLHKSHVLVAIRPTHRVMCMAQCPGVKIALFLRSCLLECFPSSTCSWDLDKISLTCIVFKAFQNFIGYSFLVFHNFHEISWFFKLRDLSVKKLKPPMKLSS